MESTQPKFRENTHDAAVKPSAGRPHAEVSKAGPFRASPANAASPGNATERRLKLIVESAPFGLTVVDASNRILAANRAALALFGLESPDAIVGKEFGAFVAADDRDRLSAFVAEVCGGTTRELEYSIVRTDGVSCVLETKGVPLPRADAGTVVLAASWDVTDRVRVGLAYDQLRSKLASVESQRDALSEALEAARRDNAADEISERERSEEAVRQIQQQMHAALAEAEHRQAQLNREWAVEREGLTARVCDADQRHAVLSSELVAERESKQKTLIDAESNKDQATALAAERTRLEQELRASLECQETLRSEQAQIAQTLQDLNRSYAVLAGERAEDRARFSAAVQEERSRSAQLLEEREEFRTSLEDILRAAKETGNQAQDLFDKCKNIRLVVPNGREESTNGQSETAGVGESTADSHEDPSWQF